MMAGYRDLVRRRSPTKDGYPPFSRGETCSIATYVLPGANPIRALTLDETYNPLKSLVPLA